MNKVMRLTSLVSACLVLSLSGCGGLTGPDATPETFRGSMVFDDGFSNPLPSFPIDVRGSGTLDASLTWTVAAPGTGRFGGNDPELLINIFDPPPCFSFEGCPPQQSHVRPAPPVTLSVPVQRGTYEIVITNALSCGGCRVDFTLTVMHP